MARAIFKGRITWDDVAIPVKLYAAVSDRRVHFRLLHADDGVPVQQRMVHPETGDTVPNDQIKSGFETDDGRLVVLDDEELAGIEPTPSRDLEVLRFVDEDLVPPPLFLRPYWLGPDGAAGDLSALVHALEAEKAVGIVRWVMRKRVYRGALRPLDGRLLLVTLRSPDEVVSAQSLPSPAGPAPTAKEIGMAEQLVGMLAGELDMSAFHDDLRERVAELVKAKAAGKKPKLPKVVEKEQTDQLLGALRASVEAQRGRKVA